MIIPIRCFTCGKPIGHLYEEYKERRRKGVKEKEILDSLGLERYCCRRMLLTHVDLLDEVLAYEV
ncbi:MAG: DNA-directed RNA polymerase subunit N [Candidatus Methanofastidiosia archaeon]